MSQKPSAERIQLLNRGIIETKNLMDALAIDFNVLLKSVFPHHNLVIDNTLGITRRMAAAADVIHNNIGMDIAFNALSMHSCDTLRGVAAYMLALKPVSISQLFELAKPLVQDSHFGVREWIWLALRPAVIRSLDEALAYLSMWGHDSSIFVRRFAVEITRPRGVWCSHIPQLKDTPQKGLPILDPSISSGEKYLRESVANWLNDASKSQPDWVVDVCNDWKKKSPTRETQWICTRALRTITKNTARAV